MNRRQEGPVVLTGDYFILGEFSVCERVFEQLAPATLAIHIRATLQLAAEYAAVT